MNIRPVDHKLYRGSRPIDIPDLRTLARLGVVTIISLETLWHRLFGWENERHWWQHDVMQVENPGFHRFPLSNLFPPTKERTRMILDMIRHHQEEGGVYVHCYAGVDRTGWIVASYRVRFMRWGIEDAWSEAKKEGMHWRYYWWKPFFKKLWSE